MSILSRNIKIYIGERMLLDVLYLACDEVVLMRNVLFRNST